MKLLKLTALLAMSVFLTACAQQEEPPMVVEPEPTYDKYGNPV